MYRTSIREHLAVYLVMDLSEHEGRPAVEMARAALQGGVTMLQLREKTAPMRQVLELGSVLRELCAEYKVPFVVNDRVDLALLLGADGVHVGQDDLPGVEARRLLGPEAIVGISAGNLAEAEWAAANDADYLGVGPVYATLTKSDAGEAVGPGLISQLRELRPRLPIVGIGGITPVNAAEVIRAGADGAAVVSAITRHSDPRQAAAELAAVCRNSRSMQ